MRRACHRRRPASRRCSTGPARRQPQLVLSYVHRERQIVRFRAVQACCSRSQRLAAVLQRRLRGEQLLAELVPTAPSPTWREPFLLPRRRRLGSPARSRASFSRRSLPFSRRSLACFCLRAFWRSSWGARRAQPLRRRRCPPGARRARRGTRAGLSARARLSRNRGLVAPRVRRAEHLHVRTRDFRHAAVEIKLVLLRVLVVLNHGGEVLERARAVARARVAPPRFVLANHAHCMSYRLDAWSPSRAKSAAVRSAFVRWPFCNRRLTHAPGTGRRGRRAICADPRRRRSRRTASGTPPSRGAAPGPV